VIGRLVLYQYSPCGCCVTDFAATSRSPLISRRGSKTEVGAAGIVAVTTPFAHEQFPVVGHGLPPARPALAGAHSGPTDLSPGSSFRSRFETLRASPAIAVLGLANAHTELLCLAIRSGDSVAAALSGSVAARILTGFDIGVRAVQQRVTVL